MILDNTIWYFFVKVHECILILLRKICMKMLMWFLFSSYDYIQTVYEYPKSEINNGKRDSWKALFKPLDIRSVPDLFFITEKHSRGGGG